MKLVDDWRPTASRATLKRRAQILARVRDYFARCGVLEVETPVLSSAGSTDPNLHSFAACSLAPGAAATPCYLHTSPEFAMKRLLAAGSGSIYQICKVFRGGEIGRLHNPEFTLLEWYRVGLDHHALIDDVAALLAEILDRFRRLAPYEKLSYAEVFLRHVGVDPHKASTAELAAAARAHGISVSGVSHEEHDSWRDLLLTHLIEPHLGRGRLTFVYDYPARAAALARVRPGDPPLAERFELYLDGVELANGFHELADAAEQRRRFEENQSMRRKMGAPTVPPDERLIAALAHGLPDCSGVALGMDRLVMLAAGVPALADVIAFPVDRA